MTTPTAPPTTAPIQTTQQGPAISVTGPLRERYDETVSYTHLTLPTILLV